LKKNFWKNFGELGVFMNMKYTITESRLEKVVLDFLDSNLAPYDGWNPEEYIEELKDGSGELYLFWDEDNTDDHMYYLWKALKKRGKVYLTDYHYNFLTDLFGEHWKPIFIKWFEENTKLPVKSVENTSY
jgi:hypothetical protein